MNIARFFNQIATINSLVIGRDASGGATETETPIFTDINCGVRQLSGREAELLGREMGVIVKRFYFPTSFGGGAVVIGLEDWITFKTIEHDVERVDNPHFLGRFLQVDAVERD